MTKKFALAVAFTASCLSFGLTAEAQKPLAIQGGKIITMTGETIEDGVIIFRDGVISDVGKDLKIPVEAKIIDASGKVIMPGFMEAHSSSGMSQANETNPIVPYVSVLDSIDPMNSYFQDARRNGITSVAITPGNSTMIGGQAAVIKTGGEFIDAMVLKADAGVKISLRPVSGSRMSHLAKLRKTLDDVKKKMAGDKADDDDDKDQAEDGEEKETEDDDQDDKAASEDDDDKKEDAADDKKDDEPVKPETELDRAMFALLKGELPAIIYCDKAMDISQAMRLIEDYQLDAKLVLGPECYKAAKQLADFDRPVIIDDTLVFWEEDPRTKEEEKIVLPQIFRDHNIKFTFQTARNGSATLGSNYLWYQAATAVKYGMPVEEALEALTIVPAKLHGVDKFIGTIEKGKDGDVVILSGDPLKIDTWVEKTIVNGEIVYTKEEDDQLKRLLTGEESMPEASAKRDLN